MKSLTPFLIILYHIFILALSFKDDVLVNDESRLISDLPKVNVEQIPSSRSSTYHNESVNVIYVFITPKRLKRPIIHVTAASPSPKEVKSFQSVPFENDSSDLFTGYTQSKAPSYRMVAHTYNIQINKKHLNHPQPSLPPFQPDLPQAPNPLVKQSSDYNVIEQLHVTLTKMSLWDLLHTAPIYQGMLQEALQKILLPSFARPPNVNALMDHIHADSPNITFYPHELPSPEVRNLVDPLMIIVHVNSIGIRQTLVDIGSALDVCGVDLLPKIKVDPNSLASSSLFICGFDNSGKSILGMVILPLKVGLVTILTLVYVIPTPLSYNLLLGTPWLHDLGAISSMLHGSMKFVANNQVVTIKVDPDVVRLYQVVALG